MFIAEDVLHTVGAEIGYAICALIVIALLPWDRIDKWLKKPKKK